MTLRARLPDLTRETQLGDRVASLRLCVFDVDGTLLNSHHQVSAANVAAIADARARGIDIMLATSRSPGALKAILHALPGPEGEVFIASQGTILARLDRAGDLEILEHRPLPLEDAIEVIRRAGEAHVSVSWYTSHEWLVLSLDDHVRREAEITGAVPTVARPEELTAGPDKIMLVGEMSQIAVLQAVADAVPASLQAQFSNINYLEITASGVDKASTLSAYCLERDVSPHEVLAMGDGPNDLGLLSFAGMSVAPANARDEVLDAVQFLSASNDEDGVAEVIAWVLGAKADADRR
jgi:Cof subfamily protein (haloacid dehalogenase superfamily)